MGQYPELYLLVEPDKLLAGLPLLEDIGLPGTEDWLEELESGNSFMIGSRRSWASLPEFILLLSSRLDWLRSVNPPEQRLDNKGNETDGERALTFQLNDGEQYLNVLTTNWMQLALPEHVRTRCLMISLEFECASAKSKMWIPEDHPVMPLLLRFLEVVQPIYGTILTDDIDFPNIWNVEENKWSVRNWETLWRRYSDCSFFNTELVQAINQRSNILNSDQGLWHIVHLPGVGVWFTAPSGWLSDYFSTPEFQAHRRAGDRLHEVLETIPDSAIFPDLTP